MDVIGAFQAVETFAAEDLTITFDDVTQGQLPTGWAIDAGPGGVGFWTKADAASSFDDLLVSPASRH
jgi:hypothetical protein